MADNTTLPGVGDVIRNVENADGSKTQMILTGNFESALNSSATPLGSGLTFTGTSEVASADGVVVSCQTDNPGTLFFDFSVDGVNFGAFPTEGFSVASDIHEYHSAKVNGRFFRVRLVNDSGAQSYLRLKTYFGPHTHPSAPLNQNLGADADAQVVRPTDTRVDLALGRLGGISEQDKFGYISGLGTSVQLGTPSSWQHLWAFGGIRTSPTSSFTPFMASSSEDDKDVDIQHTYLDANGLEQTVTVATDASDGRTPVSLGVTATELYRATNVGSVDLVGNVGITTANNFTLGVPDNQNEVLAFIPAIDNQSQVLAFRVPADKACLLDSFLLEVSRSSGAAGSTIIVLQVRDPSGVFRTIRPQSPSTSTAPINILRGNVLGPLTDVRVVIRDVSDTNTTVSGNLTYLLVDI